MTHRYHPDPAVDDPANALLYDNCERCDQQADDPRNLVELKLMAAYARAKQDDWSGTANEQKLLQFMYKQWCINERLVAAGTRLP